MKVDILAMGVHPDDVELGCSGTLCKHVAMGYTFGIIDLTKGELGSRGSVALRHSEALEGAKILGALFRHNLGMADGFFEHSKENIISIAKCIRIHQPKIVFANSKDDRHPDHGRAAKLIADACFYAGLLKIEIEDNGNQLLPWRPHAVFHYMQDKNLKPDFCVDITAFMDKKIASILAFSSQFKAEGDDGPQTPISSNLFFEFISAKARAYGREINVDYAEGFNVNRTLGIEDIMQIL